MSPKEKTVVRAIARALATNNNFDMDSLATSYRLPPQYTISRPKQRAAMLLRALTEQES